MSQNRLRKDFKFKPGDLADINYIPFPICVYESPCYRNLSRTARQLFNDVLMMYRGNNNGNLSPSWALLKDLPWWRSQTTLAEAKKELRGTALITVTRHPRRGPRGDRELWALTCFKLDYNPKKMDIKPSDHVYNGYLLKNMKIKTRDEIRQEKLVTGSLRAAAR